jgi:hypothetical protein
LGFLPVFSAENDFFNTLLTPALAAAKRLKSEYFPKLAWVFLSRPIL